MSKPRFVGDFNLGRKKVSTHQKNVVDKIRSVLRLKPGDKVILVDGIGNEALAEIDEFKKGGVKFKIVQERENKEEPERQVILYASILTKKNFETVVEKAAELGVKRIVPVITERTVKLSFRRDRIERIIKNAVEQSKRGVVPDLFDPVSFDEALEDAKKNDRNFFFHKNEKQFKLKDTNGVIGVFVGPEGGFIEEEIEKAREEGFDMVGLGDLILKAETASIIASYLALWT